MVGCVVLRTPLLDLRTGCIRAARPPKMSTQSLGAENVLQSQNECLSRLDLQIHLNLTAVMCWCQEVGPSSARISALIRDPRNSLLLSQTRPERHGQKQPSVSPKAGSHQTKSARPWISRSQPDWKDKRHFSLSVFRGFDYSSQDGLRPVH